MEELARWFESGRAWLRANNNWLSPLVGIVCAIAAIIALWPVFFPEESSDGSSIGAGRDMQVEGSVIQAGGDASVEVEITNNGYFCIKVRNATRADSHAAGFRCRSAEEFRGRLSEMASGMSDAALAEVARREEAPGSGEVGNAD